MEGVEASTIGKLGRVRLGLEAVRETYHLLTPPARAYVDAVEIYRRGHRDYIDALHYAAARVEKIPFLTIDYNFIDFLREHGCELEGVVLAPRTLENLLKRGRGSSSPYGL